MCLSGPYFFSNFPLQQCYIRRREAGRHPARLSPLLLLFLWRREETQIRPDTERERERIRVPSAFFPDFAFTEKKKRNFFCLKMEAEGFFCSPPPFFLAKCCTHSAFPQRQLRKVDFNGPLREGCGLLYNVHTPNMGIRIDRRFFNFPNRIKKERFFLPSMYISNIFECCNTASRKWQVLFFSLSHTRFPHMSDYRSVFCLHLPLWPFFLVQTCGIVGRTVTPPSRPPIHWIFMKRAGGRTTKYDREKKGGN